MISHGLKWDRKVLIQEIGVYRGSNVEEGVAMAIENYSIKNLPQMRRKVISGHMEFVTGCLLRLQRPKLACMQSRNIKEIKELLTFLL